MQLIPILLVVAVVLAADGGLPDGPDVPGGTVASFALTLGPIALIVAAMQLVVWWTRWRVRVTRRAASLVAADRIARLSRWLIVAHHFVALLLLGWLEAVRSVTGDLVLVDELVALLPALAGLTALWWVGYPAERLLREGISLHRLEHGLITGPPPTRGRYVLQQLQVHILIMLAPILLILTASELIEHAATAMGLAVERRWLVDALTLVAALGVFVIAPALTRLVLSVRPLAAGQVRDDLLRICDRHRVRVRDILVWRTGDSMINAAVMGLVRPLRYVLLTDALLHLVPRPQLIAVMAHEIAHVRRHHLPWLLLSLIAALALAVLLVSGSLTALQAAGAVPPWGEAVWLDVTSTGVELVIALVLFGWACRRFERQADTFAVQHLSGLGDGAPAEASIRPEAVLVMCDALEMIARLNAVDPARRSWRHGSIAWRQSYLQTLIGTPLRGPGIDRVVRGIKLATLLVLALVVGAFLLLDGAS